MINRIKKKQLISFTITLILASVLLSQISDNGTIAETNTDLGLKLQYWTEGIIISDANISALSSSGTGVIDDPYIISNLNMNTTAGNAIDFDGVSQSTYWVLRDSHIIGRGTYGVYISDNMSGKGSIINCTIEADLSIGTPNAKYLTVHNNTLIYAQGSNYNKGLIFTNNIIQTTSTYSNHLMRVRNEDNIVKNNVFYGNNSQVNFQNLVNSTIENNEFHSAGIYLYNNNIAETSNNTFSNNLIDGKPFGFFLNRTGETINGNQYGQIYLMNCINTKIEGQSLSGSNFGMQIHNCTGITVDNVEVSGKSGIEIKDSDGILIKNSILEGFDKGMVITSVNNLVIQNNELTGFAYGIDTFYVDEMLFCNNTLLDMQEVGVDLEDTNNVVIKFNIITINVVTPGYELGLNFWICENMSIYYNVFISLGNTTAHPVEGNSATNVMWYDETLEVGNHYSDWNGTGTYSILGTAGSIDLYPWRDIDGDNLTEWQEVMVYHTSPFEADTDGDGFDDYTEIQEGTDPLNPKDYPGRGRVVGIVLGILFGLGIPVGLVFFARTEKGMNLSKKIQAKLKK